MRLVTISVLAVDLSSNWDVETLKRLEKFIADFRSHSGCLGYSLRRPKLGDHTVFVSGFWCNQKDMYDHFSSPVFSKFVGFLILHCIHMRFNTFASCVEMEPVTPVSDRY
ncbi:antibiotic biosynthesis monooxygenase family protein [Pseudomonas huaxiensis]|uniref:antibiotic biosynthesis monooxygenase family protein n=1 Tax=Pseudomonas huaxiensis TaxID=2213017 RepID=UPI000DA64AC8